MNVSSANGTTARAGSRSAGSPYFVQVGEHHARVHQYARRIVDLASRDRKEETSRLMQEFERAREDFFTALDRLYLN